MLCIAGSLASAYHGAPLAPRSRAITMQQVDASPQVASWYDAGLRLSADTDSTTVAKVATAPAAVASWYDAGLRISADTDSTTVAKAASAPVVEKVEEEETIEEENVEEETVEEETVEEETVPSLDEAIKAIIASKQRVIEAHNKDVEASLAYVSALIGKQSSSEDLPAPDSDAIIASKQRVIEAHNKDVEASLAYVSTLIGKKFAPPGLNSMDDLPGPNPEVFEVGGVPAMAGNAGWDPLRLADSKTHLLVYREAEVKHGRLAMLGVAGWVASELAPHGAGSILQETAGRAPSVLNGGLGSVSPLFWLALVGLLGYVENTTFGNQVSGWQRDRLPAEGEYTPGDLDFDPLDLRSKCAEAWVKTGVSSGPETPSEMAAHWKRNVDLAEIWHGRSAMLAISGFAAQEALWATPVVDQSPLFFATPVYHLLQETIG